MRNRGFVLMMLLSLGLLSQRQALAWNKAGHMVSGAIAYSELKQSDPTALARVITILEKHPEFKTRWEPQLKTITDKDERNQALFMLAARWPDDIRDKPQFHRDKWHYINLPYKPPGQPSSVKTADPDAVNILAAFAENLATIKSSASDSQKAISLCWIFHLMGDVHQPLHTARLFTTQFKAPTGDRGGTRFYVKATQGSSTISLHAYWDDLILGSNRFTAVRNRATELRQRAVHQRSVLPELSEKKFEKWAQPESFDLARKAVYREGKLAGSTDSENGEVLPGNYASTVKPIAERRVVLAGYRLSDLLQGVF